MKKLGLYALFALGALCLLMYPADARVGPQRAYARYGTVISAQGLDASRAFTFETVTQGGRGEIWGMMLVFISLTDANDSTTALNMVCSASDDDNTTDYTLQDCVSGGTGTYTCYNLTWTHDPSSTSSPKKWLWRVDIEGLEDVECTFTDTGGVAADKLTVDIAFAVKG